MGTELQDIDGRFMVLQSAGQGSMGRVFMVTRPGESAASVPTDGSGVLAVKVLEQFALVQRFVSEFDRLRQLSHPAFISAHELGVNGGGGELFSVLEWASGRPLDPVTERDRGVFVSIAAAALRGIGHLHRHGLVHGDLAPPNLLSTSDPASPVKILDLGAGGVIGTGGGVTSGVLAYAAPERLEARGLSVQTDLWSLGAVLFGLVHGCHPFPDYPRNSKISAGPARQGLTSSPFDPWLDRLLAELPEDRFPTAQSALEALADLIDEDVCTLPLPELHAGLISPPFVDVHAMADRMAHELGTQGDMVQPHTLTIGGSGGTGRTRLLMEVGHRLAARSHRVIREQVLPTDGPAECLRRLVSRLAGTGSDTASDHDAPMTMARILLQTTRSCQGPVALLLDDVDRGAPSLQRAVDFIRETVKRQPDRTGPILWVVVDDTRDCDHHLMPWASETIETLLERIYPQRRVGARVAAPLCAATRGLPGLLLPHLHRLARQGHLTVSAAAVQIDEDASAVDDQVLEAATQRLQALPPNTRHEACLLAHARGVLPVGIIESEARAHLSHLSLTVVAGVGPRATLALRGADLVEAARQLVSPRDAANELAQRWSEWTLDPARAVVESLIYSVLAGDEEALTTARAELVADPRGPVGSITEALLDEQWPVTDEQAIAAGDAMQATGAVDQALQLYQRAIESSGDHEAAARCRQGSLEAHRARHAQAIEAYEAALAVATGEDRAEALAGLARSAVLTGRLDEADSWCREGLELAQGSFERCFARLTYTSGLIAWYRGDLSQAEGHLNEALKHTRAAGDTVEGAAVVTALGLVAHRREALDEAEDYYREALTMGETAGDPSRVLTALQNLAVVQHQRGTFAEALATYEEAFAMARGLGQVGRVIQLSGNLGNLWRYLGQREDARRVLEDGLTRARDEGDRFMEGSLLLILGEVALDHAEWATAETLLDDALAATEATQSATEQAEVLLALTSLATEQGRSARAIGFGERALDAANKAEREALVAQAHSRLARALSLDEGDMERAETHAAMAVDHVASVSNPDHRWGIHFEAMRAAKRKGDETEMGTQAAEVKRLLQGVIDGVPAAYREAFRTQRERHRAWLEAENMTVTPLRVPVDSGRSRERWTRLLEVSRRMATEHNPDRLLEYIMDSAVLLCGAERGFLLLVDEVDPEKMPIRVARNIDQENIRNTRLKISRSIARRVVMSGEALLTIDAMEDDRYREQLSVHDLKLRSVLCLPMTVRGRVVGAIYLDNRFQTSAFDEDDSIQMQAFAGQAAVALDTARLLGRMAKTQTELEQARAEVEALNQKLREQLDERTQELEATHRVVIEQRRQLEATYQYDSIIGSSEAIRRIFQVMDRLLDNTIPVLIEGESGTGKELVARAIHFSGKRKDGPFVAINCGAIPTNLLESELFGHVRGAFTGATTDKLGLFEAADGGTLLLDELGELPLEMQVKLLRVLQSGEIQKVGATRERTVDVRVIAATNRRLNDEVAAGRFREDLYYRLAVIPVRLPPLRERQGDIPLLVQHFLDANRELGVGAVDRVSSRALSLLCRYTWPGNVRQLEMVLKNASLFADSKVLQPSDFAAFPEIVGESSPRLTGESLSGRTLADIEREAVIQALQDTGGNKKRAAEQLGIDRRTLYNKLAAYKIVVEKKLKVK